MTTNSDQFVITIKKSHPHSGAIGLFDRYNSNCGLVKDLNSVVDVYTNDRKFGMFHIQLLVLDFFWFSYINAYTFNGAKKMFYILL